VSLIGTLAVGYYIYGHMVKKHNQGVYRLENSTYLHSFFNQRGQKLSELDGMLKLSTDPFTIYKNYPNQKSANYSINKYGFRDGYTSNKPYTAIVLGGSAAFGFALDSNDKTFSFKISLYNRKYNVINSAVIGFLSGQELAQMVHYLDDFNPALYIVFDGWNDIYGPYALTKSWPVVNPPIGYVNAFLMIENRLAEYFQTIRKEKNLPDLTLAPIGELLDERVFFKEILKKYTTNILKMHHFANSRGAEFLLVFQPELGNKKKLSNEEKEALESWNSRFAYHDKKISERYKMLISEAKKIFQEKNIAYIDINSEPEFTEIPQTLFYDVVHPNELGHEIIAKIINHALSTGAQNIALSRSTTPPLHDDKNDIQAPRCVLTFVAGWHAWEYNGFDWWRWTDGHGEIRVLASEDSDILMHGEIYSIGRPNTVDVLVNREKVATLDISWDLFKAFEPVALHLKAGETHIVFVSHNPAVHLPTDSRPLALAVRNLRAAGANGATVCELQL
jgi:lysophospholipase L1-like esterase